MTTEPYPPQTLLTLAEYANLAGLSVKTVRRKVRRGEIPAQLIAGPHGPEYRIGQGKLGVSQPNGYPTVLERVPTEGSLPAFLDRLDTMMGVVDKLSRENMELAGRLGFYQSEIQHLKAQLEWAQLQLQLAQARIL